jgi:hypothetical protein
VRGRGGPPDGGPRPGPSGSRGAPWALGLLLHRLRGSVLCPRGFLALPPYDVPGPPRLRGRRWAVCLWLVLESSSPHGWVLASSVQGWAASRPRCGRCCGTWSLAPRVAASLVHERPRIGGPRVTCEPAQGKQTRAACLNDRGLPGDGRVARETGLDVCPAVLSRTGSVRRAVTRCSALRSRGLPRVPVSHVATTSSHADASHTQPGLLIAMRHSHSCFFRCRCTFLPLLRSEEALLIPAIAGS